MHAFWLVLTYDLLEDRRIDDVIIKTFFNSLLYKTNRSQVAVRLFSIDHRGRRNVVRTSVTHSAAPRVPLFCSYCILSSSVVYYWTDARQLGIYLLNRAQSWAKAVTPSAKLYYVWSSPGILSAFLFVNWNWNFGTSGPASSNRRTKQRFLKKTRRLNLRYYNVSRDENPQGENEMDSTSFRDFHA